MPVESTELGVRACVFQEYEPPLRRSPRVRPVKTPRHILWAWGPSAGRGEALSTPAPGGALLSSVSMMVTVMQSAERRAVTDTQTTVRHSCHRGEGARPGTRSAVTHRTPRGPEPPETGHGSVLPRPPP